jgi:hypothetical protein
MQILGRTIAGFFLVLAATLAITIAHVQGAMAPDQDAARIQSSTTD